MLISKNGGKFIAYLLVAFMVLSGLFLMPVTSSAENEDSETVTETGSDVTVLGATLRLTRNTDNRDKKQAVRIGIQVSNADKKKDCAITLTVGDKSYTVSTRAVNTEIGGKTVNMQNKGIYSKNENNKSIIYAVVLKGIPESEFSTPIKITGLSEGMEDESGESKIDSAYGERSIDGIVVSLQKKYPQLGIEMVDGVLCKTVGIEKIKLSANDLNYYAYEDLEEYELNLGTAICSDNEDGSTVIESDKIVFGADSKGYVYIPLPKTVSLDESIIVHINAKKEDGFTGFRSWASNTDTWAKDRRMSDILECSKESVTSELFTVTNESRIYDADNKSLSSASAICIKGPNSWTPAKNFTVNSVYVTYRSKTAQPEYFNGFYKDPEWNMSNGHWDSENETYYYTGADSGTGYYNLPESYTGRMLVSWKMKVDRTDARAFVILKDTGGKDIAQVEFRGGDSGNHNIVADAGSSNIVNITDSAYESNTWYDVKILIDTQAKIYTVQINDNEPVSFEGFKSGEAGESLGRIDMGIRNNAETILTIDDFTIDVADLL